MLYLGQPPRCFGRINSGVSLPQIILQNNFVRAGHARGAAATICDDLSLMSSGCVTGSRGGMGSGCSKRKRMHQGVEVIRHDLVRWCSSDLSCADFSVGIGKTKARAW